MKINMIVEIYMVSVLSVLFYKVYNNFVVKLKIIETNRFKINLLPLYFY